MSRNVTIKAIAGAKCVRLHLHFGGWKCQFSATNKPSIKQAYKDVTGVMLMKNKLVSHKTEAVTPRIDTAGLMTFSHRQIQGDEEKDGHSIALSSE